MTSTTTGPCHRHHLEDAADSCLSCEHAYCAQCLVYARGPKKPPLCLQCALSVSGVRAGGRSPKVSRRERRQRAKLEKRVNAAVAQAPVVTPDVQDEEPVESFDTEQPWWTDHEQSSWSEIAS